MQTQAYPVPTMQARKKGGRYKTTSMSTQSSHDKREYTNIHRLVNIVEDHMRHVSVRLLARSVENAGDRIISHLYV